MKRTFIPLITMAHYKCGSNAPSDFYKLYNYRHNCNGMFSSAATAIPALLFRALEETWLCSCCTSLYCTLLFRWVSPPPKESGTGYCCTATTISAFLLYAASWLFYLKCVFPRHLTAKIVQLRMCIAYQPFG